MTKTGLTFKSIIQAVTVASVLALGSAGTPAMAQSSDHRFGIFFGDERDDFLGDQYDYYNRDREVYRPERVLCMTDRQIRDAIANRGYTDISLNVPDDREVQVRATLDGWVYLIQFNFCADRIDDRERIRAAR